MLGAEVRVWHGWVELHVPRSSLGRIYMMTLELQSNEVPEPCCAEVAVALAVPLLWCSLPSAYL